MTNLKNKIPRSLQSHTKDGLYSILCQECPFVSEINWRQNSCYLENSRVISQLCTLRISCEVFRLYWRFSYEAIFHLPRRDFSQFSCSVMSDSLWPHELQHTRPPCPSPTPGLHANSHPSSWWCHPAILSSVVPFSSCPQSLPATGSFPMSQLFASGGQSIGASALAPFLPKKSQGWSPSEWTGWISLQSKGLSRVFSNTTVQKRQFFSTKFSSQSNSHIHTWPQEKP